MSAADRGGAARVGIIGCGQIFPTYVSGLRRFGDRVKIAWCSDIIPERARAGAALAGAPNWGPNQSLLADPLVPVIINLTPPTAHAEVIASATAAGRDVFTEKPLSTAFGDAAALVTGARDRGLLLGSATDTFLGSAGQTARTVIDSGELGEILSFTLFSSYSQAETWHPDPRFLFAPGGGPLLDAGPYFVAALVNLLGPVARVSGRTLRGELRRVVTAPNRQVDALDVTVPTHAVAIVELASGAVGSLITSFEVWNTGHPAIEIYGTRGVLAVPHPNWFGGDVTVQLNSDAAARVVPPVTEPIKGEGRGGTMLRGYGVMDLIGARRGEPHRTSGDLALHVLEVLEAVQLSSQTAAPVQITTRPPRPAPLSQAQLTSWYGAGADHRRLTAPAGS